MIRTLLEKIDLTRTNVMLTSDHGNIEDLSRHTHTLNPVPTLVWGPNNREIAAGITSLVDITPAIVRILTGTPAGSK
jgi:bisphosphoglycerate-independent phosphoglycerate mutase (AlkP superfamily)